MYFRHFLVTISILSVVVSVSMDYSDFLVPDDTSESALTSLSLDQTALSDDESSSPFDETTSLFDAESSPFSSDFFAGSDLSTDPDNTPSDFSWNDSFQLADCSESEVSLPPALGKSRVRRVDDSSSCADPENEQNEQVLQSIQDGKFSVTCTLVTGGVLPFAMTASDDSKDVEGNTYVLEPITILGRGPRIYYASTLYHATLRKKKN